MALKVKGAKALDIVERSVNDLATLSERVVHVSGRLQFSSREHKPRDAALKAASAALRGVYGKGRFLAETHPDLLEASFVYEVALPDPES